jgi:uncharacterized membrane protein YgcG
MLPPRAPEPPDDPSLGGGGSPIAADSVEGMTRRHRRSTTAVVTSLIIAFGALLASAVPAAAEVDDFTFDSFDARMQLDRAADGHAELEVVETIVARFPDADQNRGIVRAIPDDYDDVPLHTEVLSVTDGSGRPIPHDITRSGDVVEVATGDDAFVRGVQTYVITYTQRDSIRSFGDTDRDEFYRDINGTGWGQPFGEVSATIDVDAGIVDALTGDDGCYQGGYGASERCEILRDGATFQASATDLQPGENVTVAIAFERGTFVPGVPQRGLLEQFALDQAPALRGATVGSAVVGVAAMIAAIVVRRRGRDAAGGGVVVPQYSPPDGVTVMQAAHLVGRGGAASAAAIVDLAVAGHLRLIERGDTYALEYVSPAQARGRRRVLDALFGVDPAVGTLVRLNGESAELGRRLDALSAAEAVRLREEHLTERRSHAGHAIAFAVSLVALLVAFALLILTAVHDVASPVSVVSTVIAFFAMLVVVFTWRVRDRLTETGVAARGHLRGLRDYLTLAEADRIRMLQSPSGAERTPSDVVHLSERLLPYAIIWGVEKQWATELEVRAAGAGESIGWYSGPNGYSSVYFLAALAQTRASSTAVQAWSTTTGGSYSGGSMGGGFSGGGAGGGGGGGR